MAKSYSGNPATSDTDLVRFLIGDTQQDTAELEDEEIEASLNLYPTPELAAAFLAESLSGRYARRVDKSVGDLRISYSTISKTYSDMAARLRRQASVNGVAPYAGGISVSDKAIDLFTDAVQPAFRKGMHDA